MRQAPTAQHLFHLFLKLPKEKKESKPPRDDGAPPKPPDDDGDDGSEDRSKRQKKDDQGHDPWAKWSKGSSNKSAGSGLYRGFSTPKSRSMSGVAKRKSNVLDELNDLASCSTKRALVAMAFLPVVVNGMHVVPASPALSMLSTFSVVCTAGWYLSATSVSIAAISKIPEVMEVAVQGVEDVVVEAAEGSRLVVRCVFIGIVFFMAAAIVQIGWWFLAWLAMKLPGRVVTDRHVHSMVDVCAEVGSKVQEQGSL